MYKQNDMILIPFPYTDLTGVKQRPALIISNDKINNTEDRICCLITSKPNNQGLRIEGKNLKEGKLRFKSWIKPNRLFTINSKIIKRKLGSVNKEFHQKIIKEINTHIN